MKTQRAVSFDETTMDSCSTLLLQQHQEDQRLISDSCESCESRLESADGARRDKDAGNPGKDGARVCSGKEVTSLEEAKSVIAALRARQRAQAHQMLAWRRTLKLQEDLVARLTREKAEQLRSLSSQLLLFESRLCRKQKEIESILAQREAIILRQQRVIRQLQNKLRLVSEKDQLGSQAVVGATRDSPPCCDALDRLDSLGDSDSAVVLEEAFLDDPTPPRFRSNITDVTVIRSVSDAFEPSSKYCSSSRRSCNGYLRRPEVLETVYSVEEDGDGDGAGSSPGTNRPPPSEGETVPADEEDHIVDDCGSTSDTMPLLDSHHKPRVMLRDLYGSFERLAPQVGDGDSERLLLLQTAQTTTPNRGTTRDDSQQAQQVTYNRVMSNHRSVTKPKDVKYKRINKAKSKSLEELRGRLRNWVEKGNKIAISLDQSYA